MMDKDIEFLNRFSELETNMPAPFSWITGPPEHLPPMSGGGVDSTVNISNVKYETSSTSGIGHLYAFECFPNTTKDGIVMEPGDVVFAPGCPDSKWIDWSSISGTKPPPVTESYNFAWLEIDVKSPYSASMNVGSSGMMRAAVTGDDLNHKMIWPLVETSWADGLITRVKNLQCGNVVISRVAG